MANTNIEENDSSDYRDDLALAGEGPGAKQHVARSTERGLRATRTAIIIAEIDNGFSDQQFSTRALANKVGLSVRYVQDLVKDSGLSITERILELRLQKAHAILMNDRSCMLKDQRRRRDLRVQRAVAFPPLLSPPLWCRAGAA